MNESLRKTSDRTMVDADERLLDTLRAAVNLARSGQIRSLPVLRTRLVDLGYDTGDIERAITVWADRSGGATEPGRSDDAAPRESPRF